jgi:hypothetical protein
MIRGGMVTLVRIIRSCFGHTFGPIIKVKKVYVYILSVYVYILSVCF